MRIAVSACALALVACGANPPADANSQAGDAVRVMSLNPCIDAILLEVAEPAQIVSISHYSHDPHATSLPLDRARRFAANAGTAEEAIASLPDILLTSGEVPPPTVQAIARAGIHVEVMAIPTSIAQSREQVRYLAELVGHADRGEKLLSRIDAALAAARAPDNAEPISALVRTQGGLVPGHGTLVDELLALTGFANASGDHDLAAWDLLALEPLIANPPQVLLTSQADDPMLARIPGMQVALFEDQLLQCAGPNMMAAAERLANVRRALLQP